MEIFRCYYCAFKTNCVDQFLEQITILYKKEIVKYRELLLDDKYTAKCSLPSALRQENFVGHLTVKLAFQANTFVK